LGQVAAAVFLVLQEAETPRALTLILESVADLELRNQLLAQAVPVAALDLTASLVSVQRAKETMAATLPVTLPEAAAVQEQQDKA
jgi:hypothetical protein